MDFNLFPDNINIESLRENINKSSGILCIWLYEKSLNWNKICVEKIIKEIFNKTI